MKKLILVGGTMGVGKSSVCRALHQRLTPSVWLDGGLVLEFKSL